MRWSWSPLDIHWISIGYPLDTHGISMCTPWNIHDISIGSSITGRSDLEMPSTGGGPRRSAGRRQHTNLVMKTILKGDLMKSGEYETNGPNKLGDENHPKVPFLSIFVISGSFQVWRRWSILLWGWSLEFVPEDILEPRLGIEGWLGGARKFEKLKCVRHTYILGTLHIIASDVSPLHSPVIIWTPCDFCLIWLLSWFWTRFLSSRRSCPKSFDLC